MLDDVLNLMVHSDMHKNWFVSDLDRLILPAIKNKKLDVLYFSGIPIGMYSHAFLPNKIEDDYVTGRAKLPNHIWRYGPQHGTLYIIDFIAPFKNTLKVARWVQRSLTNRYIETYPMDRAYFIRQENNRKLGYATGVRSELDIRRFSCVV